MMNEELRIRTPNTDIVERSIAYSLDIVKLYRELERTSVGRILGKQLLRSGTSIGANVHEAQGAQSKADFIAKISISHKEARETSYWLRLIHEIELVPTQKITHLVNETEQLIKILSSILLTSKERLRVKND
jgi:four helix bundle protein